ncbi:hypothetical protein SISNIDRAFT_488157 [Sistotremastrum niveocremeum HHB9708]|uniref:Uncharacterized protein n=1 Tax=Sistotremastrum niveocremeum HHB9708 TaxID=1314777 RepID=A0A164RI61_9AGAM|nr:hypothetical protein SISNIDRAFT_488157 [Sistotremastrum niveocremeum HHB9708]
MPILTIAQILSSTSGPFIFRSPSDEGHVFRIDTANLEAGTEDLTPTSLLLEILSPLNRITCTLVTFKEAGSPCRLKTDLSFPGSRVRLFVEGKGRISIMGTFRDWNAEEKHWKAWRTEAERQGSMISIPQEFRSIDGTATAVKRKAEPSEQNEDVKRTRVKHNEGPKQSQNPSPTPQDPSTIPPKLPPIIQPNITTSALVDPPLPAPVPLPLNAQDRDHSALPSAQIPLPPSAPGTPPQAVTSTSQFSNRSTSSQDLFPIFLEQGIRYRITKTGEGKKPKQNQWVRLAYDLDLGREPDADTKYHSIKFELGQTTTVKQKNVRGLQLLVPRMALKEQVEVFMPAAFALTPAQTPVIYRVSLREIADRLDGFEKKKETAAQ